MTTPELIYTAIFYLFGLVAVFGALVVVGSKRILRSAVGLAVTLVSSAGFYFMLDYDFIAGVQILVYVGGIVVLIVFAVMLTSSLEWVEDHPSPLRQALAGGAALLFFVVSMSALFLTDFAPTETASAHDNIAAEIGRRMLDTGPGGFVLPFELISLLLLAAVIGGIVIARIHGAANTPHPGEST